MSESPELPESSSFSVTHAFLYLHQQDTCEIKHGSKDLSNTCLSLEPQL